MKFPSAETQAFLLPRVPLSPSLSPTRGPSVLMGSQLSASAGKSPLPPLKLVQDQETFPCRGRGTSRRPPSGAPSSRGRGKRRGSCGPGGDGGGLPPGGGAELARGWPRAGTREAAGVLRVCQVGSRASLPLGFGRQGFFFLEAPRRLLCGNWRRFPRLQVSDIFPWRFGRSRSPPGVIGDKAPQGQRRRLKPREAPLQPFALGPRTASSTRSRGFLRWAKAGRLGGVSSRAGNCGLLSPALSASQAFTHEREHERVSKLSGHLGLSLLQESFHSPVLRYYFVPGSLVFGERKYKRRVPGVTHVSWGSQVNR